MRYRSPYKVYGSAVVILVGALDAALVAAGATPVVAYLIAVNATALVLFGWDKGIARSQMPRVPEAVLFALAIVGASPAILVGQSLFHHKTIKPSFQVIFWLIVLAQIALAATYLPTHSAF